jgi:hypothetical protein
MPSTTPITSAMVNTAVSGETNSLNCIICTNALRKVASARIAVAIASTGTTESDLVTEIINACGIPTYHTEILNAIDNEMPGNIDGVYNVIRALCKAMGKCS